MEPGDEGQERGLARLRRLVDEVDESATLLVGAPAPGPDPEPGLRTRWWARSAAGMRAGATLLLALLLLRVAGTGLAGWAVGLGLDEAQAALVAAVLVATISAGTVAGVAGRDRAARAGALLAVVILEAGHARALGGGIHLVLGSLAVLALAVLTTGIGAAAGLQLRGDAISLTRLLRRRRLAWGAVLAGAVLGVLAVGPAMTAVQDGPISALYDYGVAPAAPVTGEPGAPPPAVAVAPVHPASGATGAQGVAAGASSASGAQSASTGSATTNAATVATAPVPPEPVDAHPGHVDNVTVDGRTVLVYVPAAYGHVQGMRFPVLYLLHGYPGNPGLWTGDGAQLPQVLDQLIDGGDLPPMLAVMPDGNGQTVSDCEWGDTAHGDRVEDWLVNSLLPAIDHRYHTLGSQARAIAGFSAGGFGAVNLGLRHPDLFRWAASWSGYFAARQDVFGPATAANSPMLTTQSLDPARRIPLYVGIGSEDTEFMADNHQFAAQLTRVGWTSWRLDTVPGGHGWEAWRLEIVHSLRWLGSIWGVSLAQLQLPPTPPPSPSPSAAPSPTPRPSPSPSPSPQPSPSPSASPTPHHHRPTPSPDAGTAQGGSQGGGAAQDGSQGP